MFVEREVVQFALFNRIDFFSQKSTHNNAYQIKITEWTQLDHTFCEWIFELLFVLVLRTYFASIDNKENFFKNTMHLWYCFFVINRIYFLNSNNYNEEFPFFSFSINDAVFIIQLWLSY